MPRKKATAKTTSQPTSSNRPSLNASEIDLSQLSLKELVELKAKVDAALAVDIYALRPGDVVVDFTLKLRTIDGVVGENSGQARLNSLLSPRTLALAPQRFEQAFMSQVFDPINTEALNVIDNANTTGNRLSSARAQVADPFDMSVGYLPNRGAVDV